VSRSKSSATHAEVASPTRASDVRSLLASGAGASLMLLALAILVRDADVVVTSHELHMLHYLGRADIVASKERLAEFSDAEFARDPRTGLPAVSQAQSRELILSCYGNGVIVTDTLEGWRAPAVIDEAASDFIVAHAEPIELPQAARIKAFHWQTPIAQEPPVACAAIPRYRDADSAS
jgi:hypothetical protein